MRLPILVAVLLAAGPSLLHAQGMADLKAGRTIVSSDGRRVGEIDRVVTDTAGKPQSAALIFGSHFIYIPVGTLSDGDKGRIMTSMTYQDVRKLP